jgi:hypothetical protein
MLCRLLHCAWAIAGLAVLGGGLFVVASTAAALTPDSPEVQRAIGRGIKFLESDAAQDNRVGAQALVGLVMLKHGDKPDHPRITEAVKLIQAAVGQHDPAQVSLDIYSTGLAIIFLVQLDPSKYQPEIDCLLKFLRLRQKPHGGWGYPEKETGDTSMTQYGVLSSWEAAQAGYPPPMKSIEGVTTWLLRTQDPSGAFGYQGVLGDGHTLVKQSEVKHSMAAAGLGSLYICANLLGITQKVEKRDDDLPPALKEVKPKDGDDKDKDKQPKTRVDAKRVHEAQVRGTRWMRANYKINVDGFTHYYLYALERYMSFLELLDQKAEKEPKWYSDGARYLIKSQADDGSWKSQSGVVPDTAFAVLFLLRSTKKSIEKAYSYGDGTLVGGRGLPKDTARVEVRGGQVVAKPLLGPAESLLKALDGADDKDYDQALDLLAELPAADLESLVAKHGETLRRLVGNKSPEARLAAVRALGKATDLDNVPAFIYALSDPDPEVVRAAHEALLRVGRSPTLIRLPESFSDEDRRLAIEKWKAWYRAIRPAAEVDF